MSTGLSETSSGALTGRSKVANTSAAGQGVGELSLVSTTGTVTAEPLTAFSLSASAGAKGGGANGAGSTGAGGAGGTGGATMSATATMPVDSTSAGELLVTALDQTLYASATVALYNLSAPLTFELRQPRIEAHLVQSGEEGQSVESTIVFVPPLVVGPTTTTTTTLPPSTTTTSAPVIVGTGSHDTWTGAGDGTTWGQAANWTNGVPKQGDIVTIGTTSGQVDVVGVPAGTQLQGLGLEDASLSGGSLAVEDLSWGETRSESIDDTLTVEGTANFTGKGDMAFDAGTVFRGAAEVANGITLQVGANGGVSLTNTGTLTLQPGAEVESTVCCTVTGSLINDGTLMVPASAVAPKMATIGIMEFVDRGHVFVGNGSTLYVSQGFGDFASGATLSGGGTFEVDEAEQFAIAKGVFLGAGTTLEMGADANPTLVGSGTLIGTGRWLWTGGTVDADLVVTSTVRTLVTGPAQKSLASNVLTVHGNAPAGPPHPVLELGGTTTVDGPGSVELDGSTTLDNAGAMSIGAGGVVEGQTCCVNPDHFDNSGGLVVAASGGTATVGSLDFTNTGMVKALSGTLSIGGPGYLQAAGTTDLAGGSISAAGEPVTLTGGSLAGDGTVTAAVANKSGTVEPGPQGGLSVVGSYDQGGQGSLVISAAGADRGTSYSPLAVQGEVSLDGSLRVVTSGGFTPSAGQSLTVLTFTSRDGQFSSTSGNHPFTVSYGPDGARVVFHG